LMALFLQASQCISTQAGHGQPKTYPSALNPPEGVHGPGLDR
jgi:hypothetical protein